MLLGGDGADDVVRPAEVNKPISTDNQDLLDLLGKHINNILQSCSCICVLFVSDGI